LASKKIILGLESGATKTDCVIVNEYGEVLGLGSTGSSSHYSVSVRMAKRNFLAAIKRAAEEAEVDKFDVGCFGVSGLDTKEDYALYDEFLSSLDLTTKNIIVGDEVIAFYAVNYGLPCIVVIAGTGSIAYGVNSHGEEARAGGWEWLVGDEGSAYDIARRGLMAAIRAYDGRGKGTMLTKTFMRHFDISDFRDIYQKIYGNIRKGKTAISSLAPLITSTAEKGDVISIKILQEVGEELGLSAIAVAERLKMTGEKVIIGSVGGVFMIGDLVFNHFYEKIKQRIPEAAFRQSIKTAFVGAAILGLKSSGVNLTPELVNKINNNVREKVAKYKIDI